MSVILQTHGNVTGVAVHKGYCFVQYEKPANAQAAIEKENGSMFLGKRIDVKPAKRGARDAEEPSRSRDRDERDNREEYSQQGSPIFHLIFDCGCQPPVLELLLSIEI